MPLWHLTVTEGAKPLPHFSCASSPERDFRRRQTRQKGLMTMSPCRDRKSAPRGKAVFAAISSVIARGPSMQINGVAHTFITAGNFTTARAFYGQLLPFMGLTIVPTQRTPSIVSAAVRASAFMRRQRSMLANDSARALSDYITTVFVRENVPTSTRRMTSL
jgi:hypothetical protein